MGNSDDASCTSRVQIPASKPFFESLKLSLKETLLPDDPFRQFKNQTFSGKVFVGLQYFVPIFEWGPLYSFQFFKSDLVSGITIASLAVPQGISYANLASIPPIIGLYSSFVPPLIYAMLGSSKDVAVGTIAVVSLLMTAMIGKLVNPKQNPTQYLHLVFTATFFAGVFQAALGFLRLGFVVDFLSHATIVGFMGGAATIICLQQLKGMLGLHHFTHETDIISVLTSVFSQFHQWRWETIVMGCCFLFFLVISRIYSKKKQVFFWINALAPLISVILGSLLVYFTRAEKHGVQVIGKLKSGLNPASLTDLAFGSPFLTTAIKTGIISGTIALAEGVAVGRSFASFKNYHINGNKEMIAFGMMNIIGSFTSCYLTGGPFSRTAVNFNAGCQTAVSNIVMAIGVMMTLLFLTPLFYYTPLVVLSSIIITAMLGLINFEAAFHLWKIDKYDFTVCVAAYVGVVFGSIETGLMIAVSLSMLRVVMFVARPKTQSLGKIPNSTIYRSTNQYPNADTVPGVLILQIDAPIYFANANYLRERIFRWISEEEDRLKCSGQTSLQFVILDVSVVSSIDTSGINFLEELKKNVERNDLKLVLANPQSEVIKKLDKGKFIEKIGEEWVHLTVGEAVAACSFMLHKSKSDHPTAEDDANGDIV